jgi:hypothetical protein
MGLIILFLFIIIQVHHVDKERLREAYYRDAADGRITEHEVKKAVEHAGGGVCI